MTQHTPGPWYTDTNFDGRHQHLPIMTVHESFKDGEWPYHPKLAAVYHGRGHAPREIAESNARLIAAAPELLAALEYWTPLIKGQEGRSDETDVEIDKARAAITKARGQS